MSKDVNVTIYGNSSVVTLSPTESWWKDTDNITWITSARDATLTTVVPGTLYFVIGLPNDLTD